MRRARGRARVNYKKRKYNMIELILFILIIITFIIFMQTFMSKEKMKQNINLANNEQNTAVEENIDIAQENTEQENIEENTQENIIENILENNTITNTNETPEIETNTNKTFTMAVTGDIMCHNTIYKDAYDSYDKTYDFSYIFDDVKYYLQTADITIGNLETTFAGSKVGYSNYPKFNTPEQLASNLKKVGFDIVSTANNHCMDTGYSGLVSTLKYLDKADLKHTGTYSSEEDSKKILMQNIRGVSIAFLSFTYGTNGNSIPKDKSYAVDISDKDAILEKLKLAKERNPDIICVSVHWGTEYQTKADSKQKELADFLFKNGVDIILGNHSHTLQPMEKRTIKLEDGTTKDGFVVYSLGNFLADQSKKNTKSSVILNLKITKNAETNKISIDSATYIPIYIYKDNSTTENKFKILDIKNSIASYEANYDKSIGKSTYNTLKTELKNIKEIIGNEIK